MLRQDMTCAGLLKCCHGVKELDEDVFGLLVEPSELLTVDEGAERIDRERSTVYRSVQRLRRVGYGQKERSNDEQGQLARLPADGSRRVPRDKRSKRTTRQTFESFAGSVSRSPATTFFIAYLFSIGRDEQYRYRSSRGRTAYPR
ncbi:helix-turn-helix domain-containing protein [Halorubrum sp. SD683]|uniref:helix-turn-helix domain-containing protein n=1 Tax=Halorubrum sp. SD683 TaxID=1855873 RepID=UPI002AA29AE3|nr:helix-turn-helix domain-containing protein [Halorubrum sp. SD683]